MIKAKHCKYLRFFSKDVEAKVALAINTGRACSAAWRANKRLASRKVELHLFLVVRAPLAVVAVNLSV